MLVTLFFASLFGIAVLAALTRRDGGPTPG